MLALPRRISQLIDALGIDLAVRAFQPLEHLRRERRKLLLGDWGRLLARLAAELLAQLGETLRVRARSVAAAHLRAEFRPPLGVDRAVGIPEPIE